MDDTDLLLEAGQLRVGDSVNDKWRIDAVVGSGGMATVYSATHRNGSRVALKVLHRTLSLDEGTKRRFLREGYVANKVPHEGVVHVIDDGTTRDGSVFLVMELLDGETADARAARLGGRLPLTDLVPIVDGLLDVLSAAHQVGIVHRDVKPENVFFTTNRVVKVLDFGIARLRGAGARTTTHGDTLLGTPAFMPPEQALGKIDEVDALSDVWAVGATMFTLLSGELVHEGETANEILIAAATRLPRSLESVWPGVPQRLAEVVDKGLAFDKRDRWSSAKAMQHALRRAADPNPLSRPPLASLDLARGSRVRLEVDLPRSTPNLLAHPTLPESSSRLMAEPSSPPSSTKVPVPPGPRAPSSDDLPSSARDTTPESSPVPSSASSRRFAEGPREGALDSRNLPLAGTRTIGDELPSRTSRRATVALAGAGIAVATAAAFGVALLVRATPPRPPLDLAHHAAPPPAATTLAAPLGDAVDGGDAPPADDETTPTVADFPATPEKKAQSKKPPKSLLDRRK